MYDVIIVGGGPSGFSAALYTSRGKLETLLIERSFAGGQMATTNEMENYPGFEDPISGPHLAQRMENQAKRFGTKVIKADVIDLVLNQVIKTIKTKEGIYQSKTVILCMGASPRKLGVPNEKGLIGSGVSYCATCDGVFFKGAEVAVIGGGDTAAEDALFLTRFCPKVLLIHRRENMRATKVIKDVVMNNKTIEIIWNSIVKEIIGDSKVTGIRIKNVKTDEENQLDIDGVFVAIGNNPNTELIKNKIETNEAGYIVTDDTMQTNIFGVYAAGDIREKPLRQVITAASDGAIAAYMAERYISENSW